MKQISDKDVYKRQRTSRSRGVLRPYTNTAPAGGKLRKFPEVPSWNKDVYKRQALDRGGKDMDLWVLVDQSNSTAGIPAAGAEEIQAILERHKHAGFFPMIQLSSIIAHT